METGPDPQVSSKPATSGSDEGKALAAIRRAAVSSALSIQDRDFPWFSGTNSRSFGRRCLSMWDGCAHPERGSGRRQKPGGTQRVSLTSETGRSSDRPFSFTAIFARQCRRTRCSGFRRNRRAARPWFRRNPGAESSPKGAAPATARPAGWRFVSVCRPLREDVDGAIKRTRSGGGGAIPRAVAGATRVR